MRLPSLNPFLLVSVLSWAFNFVALKIAYQQIAVADVNLARWFIMEAVMVCVCLAHGKSLHIPRAYLGQVLLIGFWMLGFYMVIFMVALRNTSAAEGAIIMATGPILTNMFAVLAKQEEFNPRVLVGAIVAFFGIVLVVARPGHTGGESHLLGNLLMFCAAATWAAGAVRMRKLMEHFEPVHLLAISMPGALPALIPMFLLSREHTNWAHVTPVGWVMLLHTAVMSGAVGFMGFYAGVRKIGAAGAMLYQYLVPPLTLAFSYLVLHDIASPMQILGVAIALCGVFYAMAVREQAQQQLLAAEPA